MNSVHKENNGPIIQNVRLKKNLDFYYFLIKIIFHLMTRREENIVNILVYKMPTI